MIQVVRPPHEVEGASMAGGSRRRHSPFVGQILEQDVAYKWSQSVSPVYGINLLGIRSGLTYKVRSAEPTVCMGAQDDDIWTFCQGTGSLHGGVMVDGMLVRDLQLKPDSKYAFFLRPLPARAKALNERAAKFRTQLLRVVQTSKALRRCFGLRSPLQLPVQY